MHSLTVNTMFLLSLELWIMRMISYTNETGINILEFDVQILVLENKNILACLQ